MSRYLLRLVRGCSGALIAGTLAFAGVALLGNEVLRLVESEAPSRALGSRADGRLEHGRRLPSWGLNWRTYSPLGSTIGRTAVHDRVHGTLLDAWAELATTHPEVTWQVGETGWPGGGDFWPHKTHQHGLSVDHMVPVRTPSGRSVVLPCRLWNGLGYGLHTDADGDLGGMQVDFEALAALLDAVDRHARAHGLRLWLVILSPDLQDDLARAPGGAAVVRRLPLSRRAAWVRHDNHVHLDFSPVHFNRTPTLRSGRKPRLAHGCSSPADACAGAAGGDPRSDSARPRGRRTRSGGHDDVFALLDVAAGHRPATGPPPVRR